LSVPFASLLVLQVEIDEARFLLAAPGSPGDWCGARPFRELPLNLERDEPIGGAAFLVSNCL
jgi:hypothetical protein